jgi:hypothetical protein
MDGKIKQRVCIKVCVKLSKSNIKTPEMLREAFGEHSLSRRADFEWNSCFKVTKHQQNDRKFRKNSRTHQLRPLPSNP